jgi:hypothetical protein
MRLVTHCMGCLWYVAALGVGVPWWPLDDGGCHDQRVHGLARVAYVGQRFRCFPQQIFVNPLNQGVFNSYIKNAL